MAVCSFYQRGYCKFGGKHTGPELPRNADIFADNCRNEHPGAKNNNSGGFGSNNNRFGALNRAQGDSYRPSQQSNSFGGGKPVPDLSPQ
jgi:hypothetical protein